MTTLDELRNKSSAPASDSHAEPSLYLDKDEQVEAAISGLMDYFGEDDARRGVNLVIQGEAAGFLQREAFYEQVSFESKGFGDGDFSSLPGLPQYRLQTLRCPEPGCTYTCLVTYFEPADAPFCKLHPDRRMEAAP
ncbi:MAG: hypothetical protein P8Z00_10115 [Anaerolineales bacterium]|jgi:hypothetical protein